MSYTGLVPPGMYIDKVIKVAKQELLQESNPNPNPNPNPSPSPSPSQVLDARRGDARERREEREERDLP